MDKNEILERNKKSKYPDEGEQYAEYKASNFGVIGFICFSIIILVINLIRGVKSYDIFAIIGAYSTFESFSRYRYSKRKSELVITAVSFIVAVCFFVFYLLSVFAG
jgi:hypothetical protein